jgi:excinuclease ABC subunit B
MYADVMTDSMKRAIDESNRRRAVQSEFNDAQGITPQGIKKAIRDINDSVRAVAESQPQYKTGTPMPRDEATRLVKDLERQMKEAAKSLEFEKAALLRDQIVELRRSMEEDVLSAGWKQFEQERGLASKNPAPAAKRDYSPRGRARWRTGR